MKPIIRITATLGILAVLFYSCESNHFFKSEKKLKSNLEGTWNRALISSDDQEETWTFLDGKLFINQAIGYKTDSGEYTYSIDATLTSPYLKIEKSTPDSIQHIILSPRDLGSYALKWTIIQLDEKVLDIAADIPGGGLAQIEFSKQ